MCKHERHAAERSTRAHDYRLGAGVTVIIVDVPVPTTPAAGGEAGGATGLACGGTVAPGGWIDGGEVIKLGVVPAEPVEPGVAGVGVVTGVGTGDITGVGVGVVMGVGVGSGVTAGTVGGVNVSLETITVGPVGLESSHAVAKRASTTSTLMRVIPHATATAIPRRVATAEPRMSPVTPR